MFRIQKGVECGSGLSGCSFGRWSQSVLASIGYEFFAFCCAAVIFLLSESRWLLSGKDSGHMEDSLFAWTQPAQAGSGVSRVMAVHSLQNVQNVWGRPDLPKTNGFITTEAVWFEEFAVLTGPDPVPVQPDDRWRFSRARRLFGAMNVKSRESSSRCTKVFAVIMLGKMNKGVSWPSSSALTVR